MSFFVFVSGLITGLGKIEERLAWGEHWRCCRERICHRHRKPTLCRSTTELEALGDWDSCAASFFVSLEILRVLLEVEETLDLDLIFLQVLLGNRDTRVDSILLVVVLMTEREPLDGVDEGIRKQILIHDELAFLLEIWRSLSLLLIFLSFGRLKIELNSCGLSCWYSELEVDGWLWQSTLNRQRSVELEGS